MEVTGTTILVAFVVFAVALTAMAVGVIFSNRRIKGSCGGLANMRDSQGKTMCEACEHPSPECQGEPLEHEQVSASK